MGTKILSDIHKDLKLLITSITGFEHSDEGFRICERFVLSNIKHHRYLSVDGHATRRAIGDVSKKFLIHGKYRVAKKFDELVRSFLTGFDFDRHPQCDLQWSLLSLLLNLSNETNKSELKGLKVSTGDDSLNSNLANKNGDCEEIDWREYLKEGERDFYKDYQSSGESEWSDEDEGERAVAASEKDIGSRGNESLVGFLPVHGTRSTLNKSLEYIVQESESRKWLDSNVQNSWWTELGWRRCDTDSQFSAARVCEVWDSLSDSRFTGTISEYEACREILWMFCAPTAMAVFQKKGETDDFVVRGNISIPSLTPNAFTSVLSEYCELYRMIGEIEKFGKSLYDRESASTEDKLPPVTYVDYNAALVEHLNELKLGIVAIEREIMKQDGCDTFITLSGSLKKYAKRLRMIREIHGAVIIDWRTWPNWKCVTKLLSGLYKELQNSSSRERTNLCASLYISSLTVYLNKIDTWLSEGRLEDWRTEFVIARIEGDSVDAYDTTDHSEKGESFAIRELDESCLTDPMMNLLGRKIIHMGRSIELLVTLNRISDMWQMNAERESVRVSLKDEYLSEVMRELAKYNPTDCPDTIDAIIDVIRDVDSPPTIDADIDEIVVRQMDKMNSPFLSKAFGDYLPMDLYDPRGDSVDAGEATTFKHKESLWGRNIFIKLESISPMAVLPLRKVLEKTLEKLLDNRYSCASKLVKDILVNEYKLEIHLKLMRCIYMMERGHVMTQFYRQMFNEVESSKTWNNPHNLTSILQEVLSQEWPESSSRWSITVEDVRTRQVLQATDRVTLRYTIGWPINMILDEEALDKYNALFRFQLKLKWALWTLTNLRFRDLEKSKPMKDEMQHFFARRLESLRFWLMHAIGSIHAYLSGQVLQSLGRALEKRLALADNLDTIITVHKEYLEKVYEHCLQTVEYEDLMLTIHSLLGMCVHVRDRWKRGASALLSSDLDLMETSYTKYHSYIALALHNAVQHKDADYYKLTPLVREYERDDSYDNNSDEEHRVTQLSRDLLTEVAHQSLPPSGIPIPVPALVHTRKNNWIDNGVELPEYLSLNQYNQMFSYIRWYHYEEQFVALNRTSYHLSHEVAEFINKSFDDVTIKQ